MNNIPLCIKWMLCFEEPETRTLWLGKAVPRDWLRAGETPIVATGVTTRYGRLSFRLTATATAGGRSTSAVGYSVHVNVTMPAGDRSPAGGLRVRVRAPLEHAGKMSAVTVGGKPWPRFDAGTETVDFTADELTPALRTTGLPRIVVVFGGAAAEPLRRAKVNLARRVLPQPDVMLLASAAAAAAIDPRLVAKPEGPACPAADLAIVQSFKVNGTTWIACEDLSTPGGALVLVSSVGDVEWFEKGYAPYGTNWTDDHYYLGMGKATVANATRDVLGDKLLCSDAKAKCEPTWAAVAAAVPPIRFSGAGAVRTFTGSRSASIDFTLSDSGYDCSWNGSPSTESYVIALHNKAVGAPYQHWNTSGIATGLIGGVLPGAIFYFPVNSTGPPGSRYWTYMNVPKPDMGGSREQGQWQRWQQIECTGPDKGPPCKLHDWPMYWDTMWYARVRQLQL